MWLRKWHTTIYKKYYNIGQNQTPECDRIASFNCTTVTQSKNCKNSSIVLK